MGEDTAGEAGSQEIKEGGKVGRWEDVEIEVEDVSGEQIIGGGEY
jgi:hypothetical protein